MSPTAFEADGIREDSESPDKDHRRHGPSLGLGIGNGNNEEKKIEEDIISTRL